MPMQTTFPIRQGLNVSRGENLQSVEVFSEGGQDEGQHIVEIRPGAADTLINFEVGLRGGYRRINGFTPYSYSIVPGTGKVLGVAAFLGNNILASRQSSVDTTKYRIYKNVGQTGWSRIDNVDLDFTSDNVINSTQYNWTGTPRIVFTDGLNYANKWDGTTFTVLSAAGAPTDPKYAVAFKGYLFLSGYSSNRGAVTISAPLDDTVYTAVAGAAELVVGDEVVGLISWRGKLIIFCRNSIWGISGDSTDYTSVAPFKLEPITRAIGCLEGRTIQECNGDILFLSQDGIRTISGTMNIGDTEISSISRPIQGVVNQINPITTPCHATVIRSKTQYRLFYPDPTALAESCKGIIGGIRRFKDGKEGWEWGELRGFKLSCTDSKYLPDGEEYAIFGGYDGYVYRMEQGSRFSYVASSSGYQYDNGVLYNDDAVYDNVVFSYTPINENYTTVPLDFGDYTIRKALHRVTVYYYAEQSNLNLYLTPIYDYGKSSVQPNPYQIVNSGADDNLYNTGLLFNDDVLYNTAVLPVVRQSVQGSGFVAQLRFNSINFSDPYVIQGFNVEFFPSGRR